MYCLIFPAVPCALIKIVLTETSLQVTWVGGLKPNFLSRTTKIAALLSLATILTEAFKVLLTYDITIKYIFTFPFSHYLVKQWISGRLHGCVPKDQPDRKMSVIETQGKASYEKCKMGSFSTTLSLSLSIKTQIMSKRNKNFEQTRPTMSVKDWNLPGPCASRLYMCTRPRAVPLFVGQKAICIDLHIFYNHGAPLSQTFSRVGAPLLIYILSNVL